MTQKFISDSSHSDYQASGPGSSYALRNQHDYYDREDGLAHCKICGGAEASLPTDCPGVRMSEVEEGAVQAGLFDFKNGQWRQNKVTFYQAAALSNEPK